MTVNRKSLKRGWVPHTWAGRKEGIVRAAGAARLVASLCRTVVGDRRWASRQPGGRGQSDQGLQTVELGAGGSEGLTINRH